MNLFSDSSKTDIDIIGISLLTWFWLIASLSVTNSTCFTSFTFSGSSIICMSCRLSRFQKCRNFDLNTLTKSIAWKIFTELNNWIFHGFESIKKQGNHGNQILIISLRLWTSRPKFHTKKNTYVKNISVYCSVGVIETFFEIQFCITYFYLFYCRETVVISEISTIEKSTIMAFYQLLASSSWCLYC